MLEGNANDALAAVPDPFSPWSKGPPLQIKFSVLRIRQWPSHYRTVSQAQHLFIPDQTTCLSGPSYLGQHNALIIHLAF